MNSFCNCLEEDGTVCIRVSMECTENIIIININKLALLAATFCYVRYKRLNSKIF